MKKIKWPKLKVRRVDPAELDDRMLLLNLYVTQALVLIIGVSIVLFQSRSLSNLFQFPSGWTPWAWASALALAVLALDWLVSRYVPSEVTDDGGINKLLFGSRALWQIALLSLMVAICEELLFRGAIQHALGPYWTSILFAAIHVRYLKHWLMTGMVFAISYGLGLLYVHTGTLWSPIAAHFLIDFLMGCLIRYGGEKRDGQN